MLGMGQGNAAAVSSRWDGELENIGNEGSVPRRVRGVALS